jgi:hypothetical protein
MLRIFGAKCVNLRPSLSSEFSNFRFCIAPLTRDMTETGSTMAERVRRQAVQCFFSRYHCHDAQTRLRPEFFALYRA